MPAYSGLWDGTFGEAYASLNKKDSLERRISRALRKNGAREMKALMLALNGAAAGGTATSTFKRVSHNTEEYGLGGVRTIDTKTVINRATTAADETWIDSTLVGVFAPSTYPTLRDGRDYGGMAGKF